MFTWTEEKNQLNKKKHVLFLSEVVEVFDDSHLFEFYDATHSYFDEDRYINLGRLNDTVILFVVTADTNEDTQIISARKATPKEQELYYANYERETRGN